MAFTPPPPASIAARPTRRMGGVRGQDESREQFRSRMDAPPPAPVSPAAPSRRDNIIAARADGTFDAKRAAFNAGTAQHGRIMDEAGNISSAPASQTSAKGAMVPGVSAGSMVFKPASPAPAPAPPPQPGVMAAPRGFAQSLTHQVQPLPGASPAPVPTPISKGGRINDGAGFRPAAEVNQSLRAAQEARAAPPPAPSPAVPAPAPPPGPPPTKLADLNPEQQQQALAAARERDKVRAAAEAAKRAKQPAPPAPAPKSPFASMSDEEIKRYGIKRAKDADAEVTLEAFQKAREETARRAAFRAAQDKAGITAAFRKAQQST